MRFAFLKRLLTGAALAVAFLIPAPTLAASPTSIEAGYTAIMSQGIIYAGICTSATAACSCRDEGLCSLNDVMQFVVNCITFILGIVGSIALLMFIWGGMRWILANGNSKYIADGKEAMVNASLGLAVTFGAYAIVTIAVAALTGQNFGQSLEGTVNGAINVNTNVTGTADQVIQTQN